ncbi:MAG: histidine kinase, partial [Desulfobulbus sp.]
MKRIVSVFNPNTIRHRLLLLSGFTITIIITLISLYSYQLVALEKKLVNMEAVDDLFASILELRRYEKNIMLGIEGDFFKESLRSQEDIKQS